MHGGCFSAFPVSSCVCTCSHFLNFSCGNSCFESSVISAIGLSDEESDRDDIFHDSCSCRYLNAFENEMISNVYESFADFDDISDAYQDKKVNV